MSPLDLTPASRGPLKPTLREWLAEAPFSLGMSSGFFSFFAHAGFLSALEDEGLAPQRLSGSSAGALVAGAWASGLDGAALADELLRVRRQDFWDPRPGVGLLKGALFRARLDALLPAKTFAACRAPLAISVFDVARRRTRIFESGDLAAAIHASCAVPFLFHPVWIDGRPYVDGGVADRPGLAGMPESERLLFHHIASRSPWRRRGAPAMQIPRRAHMVSVAIDGLPRLGPFRLGEGRRAFDIARRAAKSALERPVLGPIVRV